MRKKDMMMPGLCRA